MDARRESGVLLWGVCCYFWRVESNTCWGVQRDVSRLLKGRVDRGGEEERLGDGERRKGGWRGEGEG